MSTSTPSQPTLDVGILPLTPRLRTVWLADIQPDSELHAPPPTPAFVASIRDYMLFYGPVLREGDTHYEVIDGRGRVLACREIAAAVRKQDPQGANAWLSVRCIDPVRAQVFPAGWGDKAILGEMLNLQRRDNLQTSLEAILRWQQFPAMPETDFASRVLHCSLGTLRRRALLLKLLPELRDALFAGTLSQNTALALARAEDYVQKQALARLLVRGKLRGQDVREFLRVQDQDALGSLPPELFNVPAAPPAPPAPAPVVPEPPQPFSTAPCCPACGHRDDVNWQLQNAGQEVAAHCRACKLDFRCGTLGTEGRPSPALVEGCQCDPVGSGEEYCNRWCEVLAGEAVIMDERDAVELADVACDALERRCGLPVDGAASGTLAEVFRQWLRDVAKCRRPIDPDYRAELRDAAA